MPMTALIDIVFLLLIYFLLTTSYLTSDILPVELPVAETATPQQEQMVTISLDSAGVVYLDGLAISDKELLQGLQGGLHKQAPRSVVLRSDRNVALERVVTVLDIVRTCGVEGISLATSRVGSEP